MRSGVCVRRRIASSADDFRPLGGSDAAAVDDAFSDLLFDADGIVVVVEQLLSFEEPPRMRSRANRSLTSSASCRSIFEFAHSDEIRGYLDALDKSTKLVSTNGRITYSNQIKMKRGFYRTNYC